MAKRKKEKKAQYHSGRIKNLVETVVLAIKQYPEMLENTDKLHSLLKEKLEGYGKVEHCFNCRRSMKIQVVNLNPLHTILLRAMANSVREEVEKGVPFTQANRTHIDKLWIPTAVKKQQSNAGYLNLIKQPEDTKKSGYWVITNWGWAALRGEQIHESARVWNKMLLERSPEMTTLGAVNEKYLEKMEEQRRYGKAVKQADYRVDLKDYKPVEWANYGGSVEEEI